MQLLRNNRKLVRIILLLLYCIPFSFMAVYGDATSGTMLLYAAMIVGFACLCFVSIITGNALLVLIGNVLSLASSYLFALILRLDPMAWYFKPVTSHIMILINSIVLFIIQGIAVVVCLLVKARGKRV